MRGNGLAETNCYYRHIDDNAFFRDPPPQKRYGVPMQSRPVPPSPAQPAQSLPVMPGTIPTTAVPIPVTVDICALTVLDGTLHILIVERGLTPFAGQPALPGGFVLPNETLEQAAQRELAEETGIIPPGHLEQLRTYGPLNRDPRGPVLSVAFLLLAPADRIPQAGGDAADAHWLPLDAKFPRLAFDHMEILHDAVERARAKIEYSPLAATFCPEEFTIAQLRQVYEAVWGTPIDPRNFHRKISTTPGFLESTGRFGGPGPGRPAELFRLADNISPQEAVLHPPLLRHSISA